MNPNCNSTLIQELRDTAEISVRSYNVCCREKISTIADLHSYLLKNEDFLSVKNCGAKSNLELIAIYKHYYSPDPSSPAIKADVVEIPNPVKFIDAIEAQFDKLSVRAKNSLLNYFRKKPKWIIVVKEEFIDKTFKIEKLKNVGAKTTIEIEQFIDNSKDLFYTLSREELSPLELNSSEIKKITGVYITDNIFLAKYSQREFPIIEFSAKYLKQLFKLDDVELTAVKVYFDLVEEKLSLEEIGDRFKLTQERVRQKREKAIEKIFNYCDCLKRLLNHSNYQELLNGNRIICLPGKKIGDICFDGNQLSWLNTNLINLPNNIDPVSTYFEVDTIGGLFSVFILQNIFDENYYSISRHDRIKKPKDYYLIEKFSLHKNINGNYLVRKDIISKEGLIKFIEGIFWRICTEHDNDVEMDVCSILDVPITEDILVTLEIILHNEFGLELIGQNVTFRRNTKKLVYEYALAALQKINKPAHVSDIISEIKKVHPEFESNENSLKSAMRRYKDTFIFFGRTSTFGLKKWELTFKNIKGGTIRDIVEEFLKDCPEPCHITSITRHVNKYRKTDETSVITNLKMTVENRFIFFKNGYIGLGSKNYEKSSPEKSKKYRLKDVSMDDLLSSIFSK